MTKHRKSPFREWLSTVPLRYWANIFAFASLGLGWGHAITFQPPPNYKGYVDASSIFLMGILTMMGGIIAIIGMLMTTARRRPTKYTGLWVEFVGTVLLAGGPLQYLGLQIGYLIDGQWDQRYALAWFAESMLAFMIVRFAIVIPGLIKQQRGIEVNRR